MTERRGLDFAALLASVDGAENEPPEIAREAEKIDPAPIVDSLRLSVSARNVMLRCPRDVEETKPTPLEPEKRIDLQGNKIRLSREGIDLAANENRDAAWETVIRKKK
ncbi:MAG: hypothetical protein HDQ93_01000 [Desulfovibrio sp.]|nr:hypothetical protein [Desulfovibrio sp.]